MTIRPATADDVPFVIPMVAKICALHESWDPQKYGMIDNVAEKYRGWLTERANDPKSVFLVACVDENSDHEKCVAFVVATIEREIPIYRVREFGFIHDLWVEPEYRNEGIGRQMTMLVIERLREIGVKQIRLDTAAKNDAARSLFASCGFRVSMQEMLLEIS